MTTDRERRLFVACGAACGIAVAFRSPIGGVMFVLEEATSFFDMTAIVRLYFVCVVSYFVLMMVASHR